LDIDPGTTGSTRDPSTIQTNTPGQKKIGWHTLSSSWFQIIGYIIILLVLIYLTPPWWASLAIIDCWIVIRALWYNTFSPWKTAKSILLADFLILCVYALYWFIGGFWALLLVHSIMIGLIIKGNWQLIRQADRQIKDQLDIIIAKEQRYKQWKKQQSSRRQKH
jgi:hypothetical protein